MKKGWSSHQTECNIHDVDDIKTTIATPYMMQDVAPSDVIESLPESSCVNHNHLVRSVNTDGTVEFTQIENVSAKYQDGDYANVASLPEGGSYKITLKNETTGQSGIVTGSRSYDVIHPKSTNPLAARLAGIELKGPHKAFRSGIAAKLSETTELWPNPKDVSREMASIPINAQDTYSIQLDDNEPQHFRFNFDQDIHSKELQQSRLGKFYNYMNKVQAIAGHAKATESMTFMTADGDDVVLEFDSNKNVVAIHYNFNKSKDSGYTRPNKWGTKGLPKAVNRGRPRNFASSIQMKCDSGNINHVTALTMALKDRVGEYDQVIDAMKLINTNPRCTLIRDLEMQNDKFKGQLKQLEEYQAKLNKSQDALDQDMKINSLINTVMEDQYEHIGASMTGIGTMLMANLRLKILDEGKDGLDTLVQKFTSDLKITRQELARTQADLERQQEKEPSKGWQKFRRGAGKLKRKAVITAKKAKEKSLVSIINKIQKAISTNLRKDASVMNDEAKAYHQDAQEKLDAALDDIVTPDEMREPKVEAQARVERNVWGY